jgi:glucuronate isomerase
MKTSSRPGFLDDDFLLHSKAARRLYHEFAADEPIIDYHSHLPPHDLAGNRQFKNLFEIWLEGDHYKWRAMRTNGVAEDFCTGQRPPLEKFMAWAGTVPHTLGNPLYHWSHLELQRYFGITELLDEKTAPRIWARANAQLATGKLNARAILHKFRVRVVCTTDDPVDDLAGHKCFAATRDGIALLPTFRPDKALAVGQPENFKAWLAKLAVASGMSIRTYDGFLAALKARHDFFHAMGCRLSDHGLEHAFASFVSEAAAARIFKTALAGKPISPADAAAFASNVMLEVGRWNAARGWTMQLHLGAMRNNNTRLMRQLGPDTGFDSIGDWPQVRALRGFLDRLDSEAKLPKTILYNLNPADNYAFATMLGNFQDGSIPGKVQLGSGWWFLDQKQGMEWQLQALSNLGLLSRFVGMLTDSRSLMSFPRHEYFRRVLCNQLGRDMANGELPGDFKLVGGMVRNICFANARAYFNFPAAEKPARKHS